MKGQNIRTSVRITFEEACFGVDKEIDVTLKEECATCHGTGAKPGTSPETCKKCGGKGQVVFTQQSLFGVVRNVQACPDCHGTGKIIKERCSDCSGSGYISKRKKISVSSSFFSPYIALSNALRSSFCSEFIFIWKQNSIFIFSSQ